MDILVVDIETTHLSPMSGEIVEVGVVLLNVETGHIQEMFHAVCREPGVQLRSDAWIFQNSDLKLTDVEKAIPFAFVVPILQTYFYQFPVTAFNQAFDFKYLEDRGLLIPTRFWDPMLKLTDVMCLPGRGPKKYKWPKAQEAYDYFFPDDPYTEQHRALDDARLEAKIIYETYKIIGPINI